MIAIGDAPAVKGREVTVAVVDHELLLLDMFAIHPPNATVTTLGRSPDGRTIISSYVWFAADTLKEMSGKAVTP